MDRATYAEAELVQNRASLLLSGGTAAERQAWAEEAALRLGCALRVVTAAPALSEALALKQGVVLVENVLALGDTAQQQLVRCLQTQEERPKLVVGLPHGPDSSLGGEGLRPDLQYALRVARVDLDSPGLRDELAKRRARRPPSATAVTAGGRAAAARVAPRRPAGANKRGKRPKARARAAKSSRR